MNPVVIFRSLSEASAYCQDHGYNITKQGLIYAIKKHQDIFVHSVIGTYYPKIYVDELDEYINLPDEEPTEEEMTLKQAAEEYDIPVNTLYPWIYKGVIPYRRLGRGYGVIYVKRKDIEEYRDKHFTPRLSRRRKRG